MAKFKKLSIVVFEPTWANPTTVDPKHPLKYGEQVLYMGDISNAQGHCAVATFQGEVVWLVHSADFRLATDDET